MRSIHTAVLKRATRSPPGSALALADQTGSTYQLAPTKGLSSGWLSTWPVELVLLAIDDAIEEGADETCTELTTELELETSTLDATELTTTELLATELDAAELERGGTSASAG